MKRQNEVLWVDEDDYGLVRKKDDGSYSVLVGTCDAARLAELGKAIFDGLRDTKDGHDLLMFAQEYKFCATCECHVHESEAEDHLCGSPNPHPSASR